MRRPATGSTARWGTLSHLGILCCTALLLVACAPSARVASPPAVAAAPPAKAREPTPREGAFPLRSREAPTGSQFLASIRDADEQGRERAILREIRRGNVPDYLRRLVRVDFRAQTKAGRTRSVTLWVTPDYLSIGDTSDNVRMPMSPITAQLIADGLGFVLPTTKIVNIIYQKATIKLKPRPIPPSAWMVRSEQFARHDAMIDAQLGGRTPQGLVAGDKKDIVLSNRLEERPHRLALYGWHESDGHPIQPLTTVHGDWYCDYSHGLRLIAPAMLIDGQRRRVAETLKDPDLAYLLSDEGPLVHTRYRVNEGPGKTKWWPTLPDGESSPVSRLGPAR